MSSIIPYILLALFTVFLSSLSQIMLKKEAIKKHSHWVKEYLNPLVISAYFIFFITTLLNVIIYKGLPLNLGPILEATGYVYVTVFGIFIFKEKISLRKFGALFVIIVGIFIYTL